MDFIKKNTEIITEITGYDNDFNGIGRIDGFVVFIKGAIIGEKVAAKIVKCQKSFGYARLEAVLTPSPYRSLPFCEHFKQCGGCNLQHMEYSHQLSAKKQLVIDCLTRLGRVENPNVEDTIGMDLPMAYRNKTQYPIDGSKIGFFAPRSHNIVEIQGCDLQDKADCEIISIIKIWANKYGNPYIKHIVIRSGNGEKMIVLVSRRENVPFLKQLVSHLQSAGFENIVLNLHPKETNVIMGVQNKCLSRKMQLTQRLSDISFTISPNSFFQVNTTQTERLYNKIIELGNFNGGETVFDLYSGVGSISLTLARYVNKVVGVEIVEDAVENAKQNAKLNQIQNAEFLLGAAEIVVPKLYDNGNYADVVVVDPPRKGCDSKLIETISQMLPKKLLYISCNPSTLARDVSLLKNSGYTMKTATPVDMFPHTKHVECVVLMSRVDT